MLCRLHTVYKIIHCVALHVYTVSYFTEDVKLLCSKVPIFRVQYGKNYTGQKKIYTGTTKILVMGNPYLLCIKQNNRQNVNLPSDKFLTTNKIHANAIQCMIHAFHEINYAYMA